MTIVAERTADSLTARQAMIDSQLRVSGVNDPAVLAAIAKVPREDHVPAAARAHAYIDRAIPLADGHALPAPLFHGRMLTEAAPRRSDRALIVSSGSDYLAAVLRHLVDEVTVIAPAAAIALNVTNTEYTLLLIDGAVASLPGGLTAVLADGGRIVTGLADQGVTRLAVGRKVKGAVAVNPVTDMGIPELPEFAEAKRWSF